MARVITPFEEAWGAPAKAFLEVHLLPKKCGALAASARGHSGRLTGSGRWNERRLTAGMSRGAPRRLYRLIHTGPETEG